MAPTVALVGRPNVGKSTLFNRLTASRDALVADVPGLTRDRRYGRARLDGASVMLVDTGGLFGDADLQGPLEAQVDQALTEADAVLLLVDARAGLTAADEDIAARLRKRGLPVILVVNKIDGVQPEAAVAEFAPLGFDDVAPVSAAHGRGVGRLTELLETVAGAAPGVASEAEPATDDAAEVRVAVVGRPNVGKSTLVNRILGEQRQLVYDAPGTTRDAIDIPFERRVGEAVRRYVLIDTAGVRRKGRVAGVVEKFSVVKALEALARAQVAIVVLDAREGVVDQDLHLTSYAVDAGCGVLVAMNKWDGLSEDKRAHALTTLDRKLDFAPWIPVHRISALHGTGVGHLLDAVDAIHGSGRLDVSASDLTRLLTDLVTAHPPPAVRGRPVKLRYAHRAGSHPPRILVHGNQTRSVPASYVRYLENGFRDALGLAGNPVQVELRSGENPFAGRRNELTARQQKRRRRVIRHRKKRS